jgi:DNA-binding response OmpR family regulator
MKILLVDDECGLRATVSDRLESEGYEVETAADGTEGYEKLSADRHDLALLDWMLPGMRGIDLLMEYRKGNGKKPVIMLTAKCGMRDKIEAFRVGADDYVTKPFDFGELLARIKANLRRHTEAASQSQSPSRQRPEIEHQYIPDLPNCRFGPFDLAYRQGALLKDGTRLDISHQEYKLLSYFAQHRGELVLTETLLRELWDYGADVGSNTVYTHVSWLRKTLITPDRPDGYVRTVRGMGYVFG